VEQCHIRLVVLEASCFGQRVGMTPFGRHSGRLQLSGTCKCSPARSARCISGACKACIVLRSASLVDAGSCSKPTGEVRMREIVS
jgi:hypothetical protein